MKLQSKFILDSLNIEWPDALWGIRHGIVDWQFAIDLANARLDSGLSEDSDEIELSQLLETDTWTIPKLVEILAERDPTPDVVSRRKWIYLSVLYTFENRHLLDDPLGEIEDIYTDFGAPAEIEAFVRYVPETGDYKPGLHTHEENIDRLMRLWKDYIDRTKKELVP